ncbi:unnamed protein product [Schistocephalus solidus]|uniref:Secreted protein n=1 Tax=Schistocephalus solidus TaxID=70667 RepID=A0A183SJT9_SCHSO|nr:unnamed protein product [Schistocephalus solidus]
MLAALSICHCLNCSWPANPGCVLHPTCVAAAVIPADHLFSRVGLCRPPRTTTAWFTPATVTPADRLWCRIGVSRCRFLPASSLAAEIDSGPGCSMP